MFCTFSDDQLNNGLLMLEKAFITEYMPVLPDEAVRVYLYGLYLCDKGVSAENSLENMKEGLQMDSQKIKNAVEQLRAVGLVTLVSSYPYILRFNSPSKAISPNRKYDKDKYSDFLVDLHVLFADRELSETEITAYLDFLEETKMQQEALLMIIKYCVEAKTSKIGRAYVLTIARNWFNEGVKTVEDAENYVLQAEAASSQLREVLKALKSTRKPDLTDRQLYLKWTSVWGFDHQAVLTAAKLVKRGGIDKLDSNLAVYFEQGLTASEEISDYDNHRKEMTDCALKTVKRLGLYYEDCTFLIDSYLIDWFAKGFNTEGLLLIARYAALNGIRDYAGYANLVNDFFGGGYVTVESIKLQLDALTRMDANIEKILYAAGSTKRVTPADRDVYRTWTERWRLTDEQILAVAAEAQGKPYAMSWISSRLADSLGGSPWEKPAFTAPKQEKSGLGDFEKAEIKAKLKEDVTYSALLSQKKKLEFELSAFIVKGQDAPITMKEQLEELEKRIEARIVELGYHPDDLK